MDNPLTDGREHATAVLGRLEDGEPLARVGEALHLDPAGLVGALAEAGLGDDNGDDAPSLVQRSPKRPWLRDALDAAAWAGVLPHAHRTARLALAAGLLQVHDFWDASHAAAQQADDLGEREFSAYWHGVAHRREPDPGNAAYWFRRVGRHPLFGPLGTAAKPWLDAHGDPNLATRLIPGGTWSPFAFIDFCGEARRNRDHEALAKRLQRVELIILLGATADAAAATNGR